MNQRIIKAGTTSSPLLLLAAIGLTSLGSGCGEDDRPSKFASPVVAPDSEAAKKAIAQAEKMLKLRQEQEAKASKRRRQAVPEEG